LKEYNSGTTAADVQERIAGFFPMPGIFRKGAPAKSEEAVWTGEKPTDTRVTATIHNLSSIIP
jgi:hypothetical protein